MALRIRRLESEEAVAEAAAERFAASAESAVSRADRFVVALSGGATPIPLYRRLTEKPYRDEVPWRRTYFLFSDERCVPVESGESNHARASEHLFGPLEIPAHHVFRMKGEQNPVDAARRYEVRLGDLFLGDGDRRLDFALCGVGEEGRIAALFPECDALAERERWVVAQPVPGKPTTRLTLTLPALDSARRLTMLVTGARKAEIVARAFGAGAEASLPCRRLTLPRGRIEVLLDGAAASRLPPMGSADAGEPETVPPAP